MSLLSIYTHKIPCLTLIITITIFCWLIGGNTLSYAQKQNPVPTVKVKRKPKKPIKINPDHRRKDIKDNYKRPASKSNSGEVKISEARKASFPPVEEGDPSVRSTFWNKIFRRNAPSTYQGDIKIRKNIEGNTGKRFFGQKIKKIDFESLSRDIHAYEGNLKTRRAKQKASRAAMFEGRIKHATHRREARRYQQLAKNTGNYQGNIKVPSLGVQSRHQKASSKAISNSYGPVTYKRYNRKAQIRRNHQKAKRVGRYAGQIKVIAKKEKAGDYSFYRGHIKVRAPKNQTRHYKKLSRKIHKFNGVLRVRKAGKDMHPSVSYLKGKIKNSYKQKEKYRKWKLKWHRWFKSKDQPKHLKTKKRKPRYDKKESEIWYY